MVTLQENERVCLSDELMMALLGHTGDVFESDEPSTYVPGSVPKPSDCYFKTADNLVFISEPDRYILDSLLRLGFHCYSLRAFQEREEFSWAEKGCSHYRSAFSRGISELLEVYSSAILRLQTYLEEEEALSLASLKYYLADFTVLMPEIHTIAYQVQITSLRGAQMLRLLHQRAVSGAVEVQSCIDRLAWHCYQIFYKHLLAWLLHGVLLDTSGEFMIQEQGWDESSQEPLSAGSAPAKEWHSRFAVASDLIPPDITEQTAANILFIGKAVRTLKSGKEQTSAGILPEAEALDQLVALRTFNASKFENCIEKLKDQAAEKLWELVKIEGDLLSHLQALRDYFLMGKGDFWQEFLQESRSLMSLPAVPATAHANLLVAFQQAASTTAAESDPLFPWISLVFPTIAEQEQAANPYKSSARTGQAETPFTSLPAESARTQRQNPGTASTQYYSAKESVGTLVTAPSKHSERSNLTATTASKGLRGTETKRGMKVPDYDPAWDPLTLEYRVQWPLHLLLSPEAIVKYSRMFQYLFRLERMQLELKQCWIALSSHPGRKSNTLSPRFLNLQNIKVPAGMPSLWQVRTHMAHLISNMQLYVQVDVIQVQFEEMKSKLAGAKSLAAAVQAHEDFLANSVLQSCMDVPMFASLMSKTLALCRSLCNLIQAADMRHQVPEYPISIVEDFQRNSRLFFRLLSTPAMQSRARAPYLRLLLLRLNFNDFLHQDTQHYTGTHQPPSSRAGRS